MQFSAILTSLALAVSLLGSFSAPVQAQGRDNAHFDAVLLDMAQAYKDRDRKRLSSLLPQLSGSGYILEPWAAYWELSTRLDEASASDIQAFFTRYAGSYQEDRLRVDLLLQLGRNRDWTAFNRELPKYRMGDDKSVRCYQLLADHVSNGTNVTADFARVWLSLKDSDEACAATAQQLLADRSLADATVWQRARQGMEYDRLRVTMQAVALVNDGWDTKVNAIYRDPAKYLRSHAAALLPKTRELAVLALLRLAYQDPDQAAQEMHRLRWKLQLSPTDRSSIWGTIGKRAAQKQSDSALDYFNQGQWSDLQDDQLAWAARAALRNGNWALVHDAIAAMSATQRSDVTWIYWQARADLVIARSDTVREQALQALRGMAGITGFYEQLALEATNQSLTLPPRPEPLTAEEREAARSNPGLMRGIYAIGLGFGLRSDGVREWNYTTSLHERGGMSDRALLAAADMACRAEIWDRCIGSSDRTKSLIDMAQRFPLPFRSDVVAQAGRVALDPAYVYGLIRQESRFVMDARSGVGASGLMQVMPATAKWTARKLGWVGFNPQQLTDRATNLGIGTGYLKLLLDSFDGSLPLAAAAYNAGPARTRVWRNSTSTPLDGAIWAENIPYSETRDYVKKVLANATLYGTILSGQPQSLKARLGTVGPRDAVRTDSGMDLP